MTWLYMPCACSTATEDSSSASDSQDSTYEPWLVLSGTHTQRPRSWPGWTRRPWIARLSGMTSPPSTVARGLDAWISSLPVSTASRSARPASNEVSMTSDGSGATLPGSSLTWDRPTSTWRTSPDLFGSASHTSSPTLPVSGSMRSGVVSVRPPLEPPTAANGSGSWPSPMTVDVIRQWPTLPASEAGSNQSPSPGAALRPTLHTMGRTWPTPTGMDAQSSGGKELGTNVTLTDAAVRMWPTPRASENENRTTKHAPSHGVTHGRTLAGAANEWWTTPKTTDDKAATPADGSRNQPGLRYQATQTHGTDGERKADLNPRFVAALMGVPWDWLNPCTSVATDSFHEWQQKHSPNWRLELVSA